MPPPKATAGYTKAAQKIKYVRNRDLKLSGKELKEEDRIKNGMCEGICPRCREKVQWRFQFNKYKPLKNLANCQGCKRKCIKKAYRTLCDECASVKNVCPGCCQDFQTLMSERKERDNFLGIVENENEENGKKLSNEEDMEQGGEDDDAVEEEEEEEEERMEVPGTKRGIESTTSTTTTTTTTTDQSTTNVFTGSLSDWNTRKFDDVVSSKYSKARVTGSQEDNIQSGVMTFQPTNPLNEIGSSSST